MVDRSTILIADDEESVRGFLKELLEEAGYRVTTASDGRIARDLLNQKHFDLLISDIRMPGVDGMKLLQEIRSRQLDTEVVIITSHSTVDTVMEAVQSQAYFLRKPFEGIDAILNMVHRALKKRKTAGIDRRSNDNGGRKH
ncbi:MAG TPA: response regulator [Nitrospiria bacterium]